MSDEPSNGELGRRIDVLTTMVANLVGTREYEEFRRTVYRRFDEHDKDIAAEREAREKGFAEIRAEQSAGRQISKNARLTALGTLAAGVVLAVLTTWAHLGGGH